MLVSIAPGRAFHDGEAATVNEFVEQGGFFLCMAGSPDAGPSRPLLDKFNLEIAEMPLPPEERARDRASRRGDSRLHRAASRRPAAVGTRSNRPLPCGVARIEHGWREPLAGRRSARVGDRGQFRGPGAGIPAGRHRLCLAEGACSARRRRRNKSAKPAFLANDAAVVAD